MLGSALQFKVGLDMSEVEDGLDDMVSQVGSVGKVLGGILSAGAKGAAALGVGFAAAAASIATFVGAGAEMETFSTQLTTLMGSASAAKERMGTLFDFASSTPFELNQVVGAEITLRGFGAAAEELLPGLIDFAAGGRDLGQSALDFGKAWNQGAVGLESDTAKILRKQIELKLGTDATKVSLKDFREAMLATLSDPDGMFAGGAAKLSQTFSGMMANLMDEWSKFKLAVADAGLFNNVKASLSIVLEMVGRNKAAITEVARVVSTVLWEGLKLVSLGVANIVDATTAWQLPLAGVVKLVSVIGETFLAWIEPVEDGVLNIMEVLGGPGSVAGIRRMKGEFNETRALVERIGDAAQVTIDGFVGGRAVASVSAFWNEAERRAKGYGEEVSDLPRVAGDDTEDAGKEDKAAAERARALLEAQFTDAMAFSASMRELNISDALAEEQLYNERLVQLQEFYDAKLITGELAESTFQSIELAHLNMVTEATREAAKQRQEATEETNRKMREGTVGLLSSVSSALFQFSDQLVEKNQSAALTLFALGKAAALAQAGINIAQGVTAALASAPPPYNIALAAITAGAGAAQLATIIAQPAPSFKDTPGVMQMGQGGQVGLAAGDKFAAARNMDDLRAQVGGGNGVTVIRIGRMEAEEIVRTNVRANGIGPRTMRSIARRNGNGAGMSGRGALA